MEALAIAVLAGVGFIVAYHTYGRWLGRKIFRLSADAVCPSFRLEDGADYVPTKKAVVFGHHFTSIAGTGPIVGPAIAVMWGWLPALLWVVLGSIFIGAVHDLGALVVSIRNNGQTVGDIAGRVMNRRVRLLFLLVLFLGLTIVLAIFGLVIASVFRQYPASIFPCLVQIPFAVAIGIWLHRKGVGLLIPSIVALALMYLTVIFGDENTPLGIPWLQSVEHALHGFNATLAGWSNFTWMILLLAYSFVASVLPVWTLLQPRDYINSLQLISALGLIVVGLVVAAFVGGAPVATESAARPALEIVGPMWNAHPADAPMIFPFLFITIACGAISGFHCLVSSGTSSKQLKSETDARFVGYGGMLTEGFLATLVIIACVAGLGLGVVAADGSILTGEAAWASRYSSWGAAGGLREKVAAFVDGSANLVVAMAIPRSVAVALMGVLVASFAGTTLDTACRLQRYVVQEVAATFAPRVSPSACAACGYNLDFNVTRECPNCGNAILEASHLQAAMREAQHRPLRQRLSWNPLVWLTNKYGATLFAVGIAAALAALPPASVELGFWATLTQSGPSAAIDWIHLNAGRGGLILWPLFGATNQLLGGLAFLVIAFYLWRRSRPLWFLILPMIFMLVMPMWAMSMQAFIGDASWLADRQWVLFAIGVATLLLEAWMIVEAALMFPRVRGVIERSAPDQFERAQPEFAPS